MHAQIQAGGIACMQTGAWGHAPRPRFAHMRQYACTLDIQTVSSSLIVVIIDVVPNLMQLYMHDGITASLTFLGFKEIENGCFMYTYI